MGFVEGENLDFDSIFNGHTGEEKFKVDGGLFFECPVLLVVVIGHRLWEPFEEVTAGLDLPKLEVTVLDDSIEAFTRCVFQSRLAHADANTMVLEHLGVVVAGVL